MRPFCSVTIRRASSIWRAIVLRRSSCVIISVSPTRLHLTWPPLRILMTFSASDPATFADDNQPSRNADTGCRDTGAFERNHRLDQLQPSAYSPLGVALMGLRIAEINEDAVAQVFRNKPTEAAHGLGDALLIGGNDLAEVLRQLETGYVRRGHGTREQRRGRALAASPWTSAGQKSSRPRSPLNPKNGTVKAYSRIALLVKLPQGAASRILLTVAIMSRRRRVRSLVKRVVTCVRTATALSKTH